MYVPLSSTSLQTDGTEIPNITTPSNSIIMILPARYRWPPHPLWTPLNSPTVGPPRSLPQRVSGPSAPCLHFQSREERAGTRLQHRSQQEGNISQKTGLPRWPPAGLFLAPDLWSGLVPSDQAEALQLYWWTSCCYPLLVEACQLQEKRTIRFPAICKNSEFLNNIHLPIVGSSSIYCERRSSSALLCLGVIGLATGGPAEGLEVGVRWVGTDTAAAAGGRQSGWR